MKLNKGSNPLWSLALKANDVNYFRGLSYQKRGEKALACQDFTKSAEIGFEPASAALKKNCC